MGFVLMSACAGSALADDVEDTGIPKITVTVRISRHAGPGFHRMPVQRFK
jgi:hypothetical protein